MNKLNCWEVNQCGRTPGGEHVDDLGICPTYITESANHRNAGYNGGRICWAISGTFCGGKVQGSFAQKRESCITCQFYKRVNEEEGARFTLLLPGQKFKSCGF